MMFHAIKQCLIIGCIIVLIEVKHYSQCHTIVPVLGLGPAWGNIGLFYQHILSNRWNSWHRKFTPSHQDRAPLTKNKGSTSIKI